MIGFKPYCWAKHEHGKNISTQCSQLCTVLYCPSTHGHFSGTIGFNSGPCFRGTVTSADVETCLIKIDMVMPSSLLCKLVFWNVRFSTGRCSTGKSEKRQVSVSKRSTSHLWHWHVWRWPFKFNLSCGLIFWEQKMLVRTQMCYSCKCSNSNG